MKWSLAFTALVASSKVAAAVSLLRGGADRSLEEATGMYLKADVQYDGVPTGPEETDNIEFADGTIREVINGPPGWAVAFASGATAMQLPPGFDMTPEGKIDLRGAPPANRGAANPFARNLEGEGRTPEQERNFAELQRRLAIVEGDKTVLAVMVTTAGDNKSYTQTREKLEDDVFLDGVSLKTQYSACSHNKLNFVKATDRSGTGATISNGIVEITVPNSSTETDSAVRPAVTSALNTAFGVSSPTSLANHVMYCLPPGTMSGLAYAYINSWNSVYSDVWCNYVSAQLHEIGHNLNLAHSNEGTQTYGDQSGMMGYSYSQDDGPVMCFNNAKNFQLGWFDDATVVVDENSPPYVGPLKGQVNYTPGGDPVLIKLNDVSSTTDYYIGFNHKVKHNSGTVEGGNQVTIQRAGEGNSYAASVLVAKLSAGQSYSVILNGREFDVSVDSIDIANADTGKAMVTISNRAPTQAPTVSAAPTGTPTTSAPTSPPTLLPTPSPTPAPTQAPTVSAAPTPAFVTKYKCQKNEPAAGDICANGNDLGDATCGLNAVSGQTVCGNGSSKLCWLDIQCTGSGPSPPSPSPPSPTPPSCALQGESCSDSSVVCCNGCSGGARASRTCL